MKIRTDFVTNSSSSSYCVMTVTLKNKNTITFEGEDGATPWFTTPRNANKKLLEIKSVDDLRKFIDACCEEPDLDACGIPEFYSEIKQIDSIDDVETISLEFAEFSSEDFDYYGGSFEYNFDTNEFKKTSKPDKAWLKEMREIYG